MKEDLYAEDLEVLKNAIQESVRQMIVVEVSSPGQTRQLVRQIQEWAIEEKTVVRFFDANASRAENLWQQCQLAIQSWDEDAANPGLLVVADESTPHARTIDPATQLPSSLGFWRGMNQLREKWDSLSAQIIFLITSDQYPFFTTEADHLKRWIPLKLHWLIKLPPEISKDSQSQSNRLSELLLSEDYTADDLNDKLAATLNRMSLQERLRLAIQRDEATTLLAQRYYLPLLASAIALENWAEAASYNQCLQEEKLALKPQLRWLRLKSMMEFRQGDIEEALKTANLWLKTAKTGGSELDILRSLLFLTVLYENRNQFDEAEEIYREALTMSPANSTFLGAYARFLQVQRQDYDQAEEFYRRAIAADPHHANNLGSYALFLTNHRQDYDQSEEFYRRAIAADPNHANNLGNYASFLEVQRQDYDQAEEFYRRAIAADPNHIIHLGNLALFIWQRRQNYSEADALFHKALEADPKDTFNLNNYALFLRELRELTEVHEDSSTGSK